MTSFIRLLIIFVSFLLIWQFIVTIAQLPDYLLPSPWQVATTLYQQHDVIFFHTKYTLLEMLLGFSLGILLGCIIGFAIAFFKPFKTWFLPILIVSQAIPTFAIAPLLVLWLGYGFASKIATTILMIFFPIASNFYDGLRQTEKGWLDLAKTMNGKPFAIFWHIRLPAALPALASGIRIAAVIAPIGAIVGEWVGSSHGLGYLILNANARLQIDMMFAALSIILILSLLLYFSVDKLLRLSITW